MATVTLIIGLAGSGKTYVGKELEKAGATLFNEGVRPDLPENWARFLEELKTGHDCVIIEITYLTQAARDWLVQKVRRHFPDIEFEFIFFENNLEIANWNCINDPNRTPEEIAGHLANNARWTKRYEIPEGTITRPIYRIPKLDR